jgi:hypothetical protein
MFRVLASCWHRGYRWEGFKIDAPILPFGIGATIGGYRLARHLRSQRQNV